MTSKKISTPDYDALAPKYEELFQRLDRTQWEIGQALYEDGIMSDGARQRLGDKIGRSPKTLKTYYEVYVNFFERFPNGRPENIKHGVLEQLNRLDGIDNREELIDEFLGKYANPTRTQAETFVNQHIAHGTREPRSRDTTSIMVGGVTFKITLDKEGMGDITIIGASKVGETHEHDLKEGAWKINFLP